MASFLLVLLVVLFGIALKYRVVGIYGWSCDRDEHPVLYWGQMTVAVFVMVMLCIIIVSDG